MQKFFRVAFLVLIWIGIVASIYACTHTPIKHKVMMPIPPLAEVGKDIAVAVASRAEQRRVALTWPGLEQSEINAITAKLSGLDSQIVVIFCENDSYCGDLQLDFDNALESAHWTTSFEKPFIDTTVGISTSSPALANAIEVATHGRIIPTIIPKTAPYYALVIGHRVGRPAKAPVIVGDETKDTGAANRNGPVEPAAKPLVTTPLPDVSVIVEPVPFPVAEQPVEPIAVPAVVAPAPVVKPHHKRRHGVRAPAKPGHTFDGYPCNCFE